MAAPFRNPRSSIFHFRRVVPEALRPFFDGGRTEDERSLDMRDPPEARERQPAQAAIHEQKLAAARRALMSRHFATARGMVDACSSGRNDTSLQHSTTMLAMLETGSFGGRFGNRATAPGNGPSR